MLSKLSIVVDWGKCAKGFKPPRPARRNKEGQAFFVAWGRLQTQQIASTLSALPHPHRHLAGLYLDLDKWGLGGSPIDRYSVSIRCIPHHPIQPGAPGSLILFSASLTCHLPRWFACQQVSARTEAEAIPPARAPKEWPLALLLRQQPANRRMRKVRGEGGTNSRSQRRAIVQVVTIPGLATGRRGSLHSYCTTKRQALQPD